MSAIWRKTVRSSAGWTSAILAGRLPLVATIERYCRPFARVKRALLFEDDDPACRVRAARDAIGFGGDDVMALGFGGAGKVAEPARVVERELEHVAGREVGEDDLRLRPRKRARD